MGDDRAIAVEYPAQHGRIARRGRHTSPWIIAQTQAKLDHVPCFLPLLPLRDLIRPNGIELGSAQALWIKGGKDLRDGTVRPLQHLAPCNPCGAPVGG